METGFMLEEVQVAPSQFVRIVCLGSRRALWTGEGGTTGKVQIDIEPARLNGKLATIHHPGRSDA
jgi:hypothetical protein